MNSDHTRPRARIAATANTPVRLNIAFSFSSLSFFDKASFYLGVIRLTLTP